MVLVIRKGLICLEKHKEVAGCIECTHGRGPVATVYASGGLSQAVTPPRADTRTLFIDVDQILVGKHS